MSIRVYIAAAPKTEKKTDMLSKFINCTTGANSRYLFDWMQNCLLDFSEQQEQDAFLREMMRYMDRLVSRRKLTSDLLEQKTHQAHPAESPASEQQSYSLP